jgi:hypothetical protein
MTTRSRPPAPLAGGCLLSASLIIGALVGATQGQTSLGLVIGLGVGLALTGAIWAYERYRRNRG